MMLCPNHHQVRQNKRSVTPAGAADGQMKNKIAVLLMEAGVSYNKQRLHKAGYFRELLVTNPDPK